MITPCHNCHSGIEDIVGFYNLGMHIKFVSEILIQTMEIPEELQRRMDLFKANGRVRRDFDELFTEEAWLQVMVGQGLEPAAWHPLADRVDEAQMGRFLTSIQTIINSTVKKLPKHGAFIANNCAAE